MAKVVIEVECKDDLLAQVCASIVAQEVTELVEGPLRLRFDEEAEKQAWYDWVDINGTRRPIFDHGVPRLLVPEMKVNVSRK